MHTDHASDFLQELKAIQAESIGWRPLGEGAYLHYGDRDDKQDSVIDVIDVIEVVGVADASMAGLNVLWLV